MAFNVGGVSTAFVFYHVIPDFEFRAKKVKYTLKNVKRFVKIST